MVDDLALKEWFCREVLPLERALSAFIRRNWRVAAEVVDLRQDIYERVLLGARHGLPPRAGQFVYTVARNHLINRAKRARIVSFDVGPIWTRSLETTYWIPSVTPGSRGVTAHSTRPGKIAAAVSGSRPTSQNPGPVDARDGG